MVLISLAVESRVLLLLRITCSPPACYILLSDRHSIPLFRKNKLIPVTTVTTRVPLPMLVQRLSSLKHRLALVLPWTKSEYFPLIQGLRAVSKRYSLAIRAPGLHKHSPSPSYIGSNILVLMCNTVGANSSVWQVKNGPSVIVKDAQLLEAQQFKPDNVSCKYEPAAPHAPHAPHALHAPHAPQLPTLPTRP